MPDSNFDVQAVGTGNTTPANISVTPSGAPRFAFVCALNENGALGAQPDASWPAIVPSVLEFVKIITGAGPVNVSQVMPIGVPWAQVIAMFGSDGTFPTITSPASGSTNNPGQGGSNVASGIAAVPANLDLLLVLQIRAHNGFFFTPEDYKVTDSVGSTWNKLANIATVDGAGNGAQLMLFHVPKFSGAPANWSFSMTQLQGDSAHFVGVNYNLFTITDLKAVGGIRLLTSLGVGI